MATPKRARCAQYIGWDTAIGARMFGIKEDIEESTPHWDEAKIYEQNTRRNIGRAGTRRGITDSPFCLPLMKLIPYKYKGYEIEIESHPTIRHFWRLSIDRV
jgi:hypothetical protein